MKNQLKNSCCKRFSGILIMVLMFSVLSFGVVSAYLPHQQNIDFDLLITSDNATSCNFTYIQFPNNSVVEFNLEMTKSGQTFTQKIAGKNLSNLGNTCMFITCYDVSASPPASSGSVCREITYNGNKIDTSLSLLYLGLLIILTGIFLFVIFMIPKIPGGDRIDDEGVLLEVSHLKYLRPVLYGISWVLLLSIIFITSNIAIAYLPDTMFGDFFFVLYRIMFLATLPVFIIYFLYIFVRMFKDIEMRRMIERGVDLTPGKGL